MGIEEIYRRRFRDQEQRVEMWRTLIRHFFARYIGPDDVVLDVPCGYGEFINNIECKRRYALDLNPDAKARVAEGVEFLLASSTEIPLEAATVDTVFVSNFFEHITHADIETTIREFHRVLRPGGRVLVLQPNIRFAYRNYWMFFDHITPVDDRALEEVFAVEGFHLRKRILRFLPFTAQGRTPARPFFVRLYLMLRPAWLLFGKQTFMVFERDGEP